MACDIESPGYKAFYAATHEVIGCCKPYSDCGTLPLVHEMQACLVSQLRTDVSQGNVQEAGFDLQIAGFGVSDVYHGNDEYCELSAMKNATKIFVNVRRALMSVRLLTRLTDHQ